MDFKSIFCGARIANPHQHSESMFILLHFYLFLGSLNLTGQGILFEHIHI